MGNISAALEGYNLENNLLLISFSFMQVLGGFGFVFFFFFLSWFLAGFVAQLRELVMKQARD